MARRLRIQFPGARYHVINRGNLRHDIFATAGARRSFVGVAGEVCEKFGWRMHAYIVMRNHFHLAPVRAGVVAVERLEQFTSSSLSAWLCGSAPQWLQPAIVLKAAGCANQSKPWLGYSAYLVAIARGDANDDRKTPPGSDPPENPVSYQPPPQNRILAVTERNRVNVATKRLTNAVS